MNKKQLIQYIFYGNILGLIYFALFVYQPLLFRITNGSHSIFYGILYVVITNGLILWISCQRLLWLLIWPLVCTLSGLAFYFKSVYGVPINKDTITVLLQATPRELGNFSYIEVFIYMIPGLMLGMFGIVLFHRARTIFISRKIMFIFVLIGVLLGGAIYGSWHEIRFYMPYRIINATYNYWKYIQRLEKKIESRRNIGEFAGTFTGNSKPLTIVLVIGESSRSDHFSLNGYKRETNPLLKNVRNLVSFPNATSCGVMTHISVPCLLTRATRKRKGPMYDETSLVSVFNALGFNTHWYGAQGTFSVKDIITRITYEAEERVLLLMGTDSKPVMDEDTLPYLERALQRANNKLIVLHAIGSHFPYNIHFTAATTKFLPICNERSDIEPFSFARLMYIKNRIIPAIQGAPLISAIRQCAADGYLHNSYDNTIVYTDWFLNKVITLLKNENALFLFVSDHGESLGENGRFSHGFTQEASNWHVPMIWWASDEFIKNNSNSWKSITEKSENAVSHDHVFHSLLGCAGVKSELIEPTLNLCSSVP